MVIYEGSAFVNKNSKHCKHCKTNQKARHRSDARSMALWTGLMCLALWILVRYFVVVIAKPQLSSA
jgi:hypothetical protein